MSELKQELHALHVKAHGRMMALLESLTDAQWEADVFTEGEQWTVNDVVRHLLDAETGMGWQVGRIKAGTGAGVPDDFDIDRWNARTVRKAKEAPKSSAELLAGLNDAHAETLALLDTMEEADWRKEGRQAMMGVIDIEQWFRVISGHKMMHAKDIRTALNLG